MKCRCGNELGKPRVSPFPVSFLDEKTRKLVDVYFMGGFVGEKCWFCAFPRKVSR